jgi:hypothetical protein
MDMKNLIRIAMFGLNRFDAARRAVTASSTATTAFQPGTILGFTAVGGTYTGLNRVATTLTAGMEFGFHGLMGAFLEGGVNRQTSGGCYYCSCSSLTATGSLLGYRFEAVGTNRFPVTVQAAAGAVLASGGFRTYVHPHFGIDVQATVLGTRRSVSTVATVGVFA